MAAPIPPVPTIPDRLRLAAQLGTLVPFVGAGVSRLAGCPDWNEFANGALRFFVQEKLLSHGAYAQLSQLEARIKLSIARGLERQHGLFVDFARLLASPDAASKAKGERIYSALSSLAHTFVTTNYDDWLDRPPTAALPLVAASIATSTTVPGPRRTLYKPEDFKASALKPNTVMHIHGSIRDRDSMVFSTAQYLERYSGHQVGAGRSAKENPYLSFLQALFDSRTVLFVGYGLRELEILEYVLQKARKDPQSADKMARHYILQGFFEHESEVMRHLEQYYLHECGVELLPFSLEVQGWPQLTEVLEEFARQMPSRPLSDIEQQIEMESLLE